jgi:TPR repeat protein
MDVYREMIVPMLVAYEPFLADTLYELAVSASEADEICPCQLAGVADFMLSQDFKSEADLGQLLMQDAANKGYGRARVEVAKLLSYGRKIRRDYEKAHQLLMAVLHDMASTCDDIAEASKLLADNYLFGRGATRDVRRALSLYESAYRLGLPEAAVGLASALEDPRNTCEFPLNRLEMAAKYYELVKDEVPSCKSALAFLHLRGGWQGADPIYAHRLLDCAAKEGDYFACLYYELEKSEKPFDVGFFPRA